MKFKMNEWITIDGQDEIEYHATQEEAKNWLNHDFQNDDFSHTSTGDIAGIYKLQEEFEVKEVDICEDGFPVLGWVENSPTADEMFKKMGFEMYYNRYTHTHLKAGKKFTIEFCGTHKMVFIRRTDNQCPTVALSLKELEAINKKLEELGWL